MKTLLAILLLLALTGRADEPAPTPSPSLSPTKIAAQVNGSQVVVTYLVGGLPYYFLVDFTVTAGQAPLLFPSPTPTPTPYPTATPNPNAPIAVTQPATNVQATSATVSGTVNPNKVLTTYAFNYGLTSDYGQSTVAGMAYAGSMPLPKGANLTGLVGGTTYHYQVVASSVAGVTKGADMTFTTGAP